MSYKEHIDFQKKCQKLHRAGENQGDQLVGSCASITLKLLLIALKGALRVILNPKTLKPLTPKRLNPKPLNPKPQNPKP